MTEFIVSIVGGGFCLALLLFFSSYALHVLDMFTRYK